MKSLKILLLLVAAMAVTFDAGAMKRKAGDGNAKAAKKAKVDNSSDGKDAKKAKKANVKISDYRISLEIETDDSRYTVTAILPSLDVKAPFILNTITCKTGERILAGEQYSLETSVAFDNNSKIQDKFVNQKINKIIAEISVLLTSIIEGANAFAPGANQDNTVPLKNFTRWEFEVDSSLNQTIKFNIARA